MKVLIKKLLREGLMVEATTYDFTMKPTSNEDTIIYNFNVDDLLYYVLFMKITDEDYLLGFGIENQTTLTANKGLPHLNNVLATIDKIVYDVTKKYKILNIKFEGLKNESNKNGTPIRTNIYLRYLKRYHPNAVIEEQGDIINVYMPSVYPELFSNKGV